MKCQKTNEMTHWNIVNLNQDVWSRILGYFIFPTDFLKHIHILRRTHSCFYAITHPILMEIKSIDIWYNSIITDTSIKMLTNLTSINLHYNTTITDTCLKSLPNINSVVQTSLRY